jgi:hypothetical protein
MRFAFQLDGDGRLLYPLLLYSAIKKSRKTEFAALFTLTLMWLYGGRHAEGYMAANDLEQASARCFQGCCRIIEASPLLRAEAVITKDKITFPATGSAITAIASDYAGIAGGHPTISVFDELWAYQTERAKRLFHELVPVPTRKISCRLIVTHAGFEGEGTLLYELYQKGLKLPRVGRDLYAGDGMLMFWTHEPICEWQTQGWLDQMRRELPPNQYLRMAENRFTSTESQFVDPKDWDACCTAQGPIATNQALNVYVGVDASIKHDSTAIAVVHWDPQGQVVRLVNHRIWQPSPDQPLDFERTIEAALIDLHNKFNIVSVLYDPWQMQAVAQRLTRAGIKLQEFAQTTPNLTAASQNLFDLITGGNVVAYPDQRIRLAITRAVAVESPRGWRIAKERASHKIDIVVALAQACLAAVQDQGKSAYNLRALADALPESEDDKALTAARFDRARFQQHITQTGCAPWQVALLDSEPSKYQDPRSTMNLSNLREAGSLSDVFK